MMSLQCQFVFWCLEKYQPVEVARAQPRVLHAHAILVAHLCCFLTWRCSTYGCRSTTVLVFVVRFFAVRAQNEPQMYWPVPCYRRQSSTEAATA
jgi:hypothetical protein